MMKITFKTFAFSAGIMALTLVHHLYGAMIYTARFRMHVVYFAIPVIVLLLLSFLLHRKDPQSRSGRIAGAFFLVLTAIIPIGFIGLYEGTYNHLLKNLLYFGGASPGVMRRLYPPPNYEMPNDFWFEASGILQSVVFAFAVKHFIQSRRERVEQKANQKIAAGMVLEKRELQAISGHSVTIPDPASIIHLQFRRFAGCPICNLHLRSIVRRHGEIAAAGIREAVVFHSSADELLVHMRGFPFDIIADPGKRLYAAFGVESSPRSLLAPRAMIAVIRAVAHGFWRILRYGGPVPPLRPHGGSLGLPADFLIASNGRVIAAHYGSHAYDQWPVDELLALAHSRPARRDLAAGA